jgi:hypothetical protein
VKIDSSFKTIPPLRQIIYLMFFGLAPLFFCIIHLFSVRDLVFSLKERLSVLESKAFLYDSNQRPNLLAIATFLDTDRYYIDSEIESLIFLKEEIESLEKIVRHKNFTGDANIMRRLEYLASSKNRLLFSESDVKKEGILQEKTLTAAAPVEMSLDDLKGLLTKIEGVNFQGFIADQNRPQLICLELRLEKKKGMHENVSLNLSHLKLLQREYGEQK